MKCPLRLALLTALLLTIPGCSIFEPNGPTVPVDTDGDPKTPSVMMTADQVQAWAASETKRKAAEVDAEKARAAADVRGWEREANQSLAALKGNAELEAAKIANDLAAKSEGKAAALGQFVAVRQQQMNDIHDVATNALNTIAAKNAQIDTIGAIIKSPETAQIAGLIPGGIAALGVIGTVAGTLLGRKTGVAAGKDTGWDERAEHQKAIDAAWDQGQHALAMLMAPPPTTTAVSRIASAPAPSSAS